jgi:thiol:disulfide interchange protein
MILSGIGRRQHRGLGAHWLSPVALLAVTAATAATIEPRARATAAVTTKGAAQPFSEERLAAERAAGRPVFAYFTADWCLSCKVNENVAIERASTRDAFRKAGVVVLVGDWTRRDPKITSFLSAQGAAGVPLYLWYPAGAREPQKLPQVLSADYMAELPKGT